MAEKYYSISPYAYCANNPVRFIDPTGKWIAGTNGKPVTYSEKTGWSKNASADVQRIGNAMMLTPEGKNVFNKMKATDYGISIYYKEGFHSEKRDKYGETIIDYSKNSKKINSVEINLYSGRIEEDIAVYQQANQPGKKLMNPTEKDNLLLKQLPTVTERIGQVGSHEGTHATDPSAMPYLVGTEKAEKSANAVEMKVIQQTTEFIRPIKTEIKLLKIK
jgi:hypothetical protein